jgi:hypothetical protein
MKMLLRNIWHTLQRLSNIDDNVIFSRKWVSKKRSSSSRLDLLEMKTKFSIMFCSCLKSNNCRAWFVDVRTFSESSQQLTSSFLKFDCDVVLSRSFCNIKSFDLCSISVCKFDDWESCVMRSADVLKTIKQTLY